MKKSSDKFPIEFSLLLCTYKNDNPKHLKDCIDSILAATVHPDEMIIVKDGPLTCEIDEVISDYNFPFETKIISLQTHQTLGIARAAGVNAAKHNWIALMDSDDIMASDRFEKQLAEITQNPNIDIIGGQIAEFNDLPNRVHAFRCIPLTHQVITAQSKKGNPFNAMTVMFKKDLALKSGNFQYFPGFEDYDLWVRMIKQGAVCRNCKDVLVYARTGSNMYARRRGLGYINNEWRMQRQLYKLGVTNGAQFIKNAFMRIPVRLLPQKLIEGIYMTFLRSKST